MTWLHYAVITFICWSVFCRARLMTQGTHPAVKFQYGVLMVAAIAGLPLFGISDYAPHLMGVGLCMYLWLDLHKWRTSPPRWLHDLTDSDLRRMFGARN